MSRAAAGLLFLLSVLGRDAHGAEPGSYHFSHPIRIATASCTDFEWVSDLPICLETARLLERSATANFGLSLDRVDSWTNGTSEEFLSWLKTLEEKSAPDATLIFYFVTHQLKDGSFKFSRGADLPAADFVEAVNRLASRYDRVVLIDDCCYGAVLEHGGRFHDNVVRVYAAADEEPACNLRFGKGPYGMEKFLRQERAYLKDGMGWDPPGMTFLGLIGLKAALEMSKDAGPSVDLQSFFRGMSAARDSYHASIRQKNVQHILLVPPTADFEILTKKEHGD